MMYWEGRGSGVTGRHRATCCALALVTSNDNIYPNIAPNPSPTLPLALGMALGFRMLQQLSNSTGIKGNGPVVAKISAIYTIYLGHPLH
jgi:hypothetical protein